MKDEALIDSNILVYAIDTKENQKYVKAKEFVAEASKEKKYFINAQNLAEFHSISTNKNRKSYSY